MTRLLYRLHDGLNIEGFYRSEVDDFGFDAISLFQLFGGDERLADAAGEGDNGEVLAWALDLGFAELRGVRVQHRESGCWGSYRNNKVVLLRSFAHWEGETVQQPVDTLGSV